MYTIVLDSEFIPGKKRLTYNVGYIIVKNRTQIVKKECVIITENFDLAKNVQKPFDGGIFLKNKDFFRDGKNCNFMSKKGFIKRFKSDIEKYKIKQIWAFNASADHVALKDIDEKLTENLIFCDIRINCIKLFAKKFDIFCMANCKTDKNLLTKKKQKPAYTAENVYKFLTNDISFVESHTALQDAEIEFEILKKCQKFKKKMFIKSGVALNSIK